LIFSNTPSQGISCHAEFHKSTLRFQCQRCHEFNTWKITNFRQRHNETHFALTFAHKNIDCSSCHKS
jgi:nitrate/TMAO reductase-like tetraheme cytochrome c subunit